MKMKLPCLPIISSITLLLAITLTTNACLPSDNAALLAFSSALTEPNLGVFKSWSGPDCCTNWYGVSCDPETQRVIDITLRGESEDSIFNNQPGYMSGSISPSICQLDRLTTFVIADWQDISGEIPACMVSLPNLRILDLVGNKISGEIPADIGQLSKLTVLNLADNQLTGSIPQSIVNLKRLKHLDISGNQLSGEIPSDIGKLPMLSRALLNRNQLTGSIPDSFTSIYRLADLDLSMNQMTGLIPTQLGSMPVLSTLNLDGNKFSGEIPGSLLNSGLNILNLSRNALEGNVPDVFGPKTYFAVIDLSYNNLKGPIPKSLSSVRFIGHLDLSNNHLCGEIPIGSPFDHLGASSFANNDCLCGMPLNTC